MEVDTTLAASIRVARNKADYDAACKRLLSEKIILAWILKRCLKEFENYDVRQIAEEFIEGQPQVSTVAVTPDETGSIIQGIAQENASLTEGTVFFDIYFYATIPESGETIQLIINVEAQNKFYPGYPLIKRGIFYGGRMLSAQDGTVFTKSHYEKLRKVYSIWICTNPPKKRENTITRYHITEENLLGSVHEKVKNYDLLSVVMICLSKPDGENSQSDTEDDGLLRLLKTLLSRNTPPDEKKRVLRDEFDIPMTQTLEKEVSLMCNLSDGVWEDGRTQGIAQGITQGIAQGITQGMMDGRLSDIQNLIKNTGWTIEKAMDVLSIPESDRQEYVTRLAIQRL